MFIVEARATLLYPSGTANDPNRKHLFIVLTEPAGKPPTVLLVSVSSFIRGKATDEACILRPGDHPFIKHDSFVAYRMCREEPSSKLEKGIASGEFVAKEKLTLDSFQRVIDGLFCSNFAAPFAKNAMRVYLHSLK